MASVVGTVVVNETVPEVMVVLGKAKTGSTTKTRLVGAPFASVVATVVV